MLFDSQSKGGGVHNLGGAFQPLGCRSAAERVITAVTSTHNMQAKEATFIKNKIWLSRICKELTCHLHVYFVFC